MIGLQDYLLSVADEHSVDPTARAVELFREWQWLRAFPLRHKAKYVSRLAFVEEELNALRPLIDMDRVKQLL